VFIETEARNAGKPRVQVIRGELPHILDCLRFYAGAARRLDEVTLREYATGTHRCCAR
jgi:acyl-CoA reductase-like NAD-dependent aldehyde dehydrogenase